jgi:hypothetical protein
MSTQKPTIDITLAKAGEAQRRLDRATLLALRERTALDTVLAEAPRDRAAHAHQRQRSDDAFFAAERAAADLNEQLDILSTLLESATDQTALMCGTARACALTLSSLAPQPTAALD